MIIQSVHADMEDGGVSLSDIESDTEEDEPTAICSSRR